MSIKTPNRDEIRLLILGRLYEKYYHGGTYTYQQCAEIFSDLIEKDEDGVTGDLVYIVNKKWAEALKSLGDHMPISMFINENGIDQYENAMIIASEKLLKTEDVPEDIQQDIKAGTWDKVDEWMSKHPSLIRIFSRLFVSALKGDINANEG